MTPTRARIALVALALVLGACSGTATGTPVTGTPVTGGGASATVSTPAPTATPTPTPVPSPSGSAGLAPLPSGFSACTLLTDAQASAVNGSSYPPGVNSVVNGGFIQCVWQTATPPSSVTVQVLSTSGDTSAQEAYTKAEAAAHGFILTPVANFADEAEIARAPGTVLAGGIYVREGSIFFDVVYVGGTPPSDALLKGTATFVLGNLP